MSASKLDCATLRESLPAFLDGELAAPDQAAFEAHLAHCAACRDEIDAARALSREIRSLAGAYRAPAALKHRIGDALRAENRAAPPRHAFRLATAAAGLLLLVAGAAAGYWIAREPADQRIAVEIIGSHLRAMIGERLTDVASSDKHTVKPWFNGRVDLAPPVEDLTAEGFRLAGGRVDYIGERRVAVLVYRHRQHIIDLYVWPATSPSPAASAIARRGYNLRAWADRGMAFWAISDLNSADIDRFVTVARSRFGQSDAR